MRNDKVRRQGADLTHPKWLDPVPVFGSSYLDVLNRQAAAQDMQLPFPEAEKPMADNGEVFLSQYYDGQLNRNQERGENGEDKSVAHKVIFDFCGCIQNLT